MASNRIPWFVGEPLHENATEALLCVALTESYVARNGSNPLEPGRS